MLGVGVAVSTAALRRYGGGVSPLPLIPIGGRVGFVGHSKSSFSTSNSGSYGMRGWPWYVMSALGASLRLAVGGDQGKSAENMDDIALRRVFTTAQGMSIIFFLLAHNSLNLSAAAVKAKFAEEKTAQEAANPSAYLVFCTEPPSATYPADNTKLIEVNNYIMGFHGTNGGRTLACDFHTGFDVATMTYSASGDVNIHQNEKGAAFMAERAIAVISPYVTAATIDDVLNDITATGDHGPNTAPTNTYNMAWSSGAQGGKTGAGSAAITGDVASNFNISNNITSSTTLTVTCSIENMGTYNRQIIDIVGTGVVENTVIMSIGTASGQRCALNAVIGDVSETLWGMSVTHTDGVSAPVGLMQIGASINTSVNGLHFNWQTADTRISAQTSTWVNRILRTCPRTQPVASNNPTPGAGVRVAGTVNVRLILWKPICRKTELTAYAAPFYLGSGINMVTDQQMIFRTGTLTNGGTMTFQPGTWSGGALSYPAVRVYQGGSGGEAGIGTGTLIATFTPNPANWQWVAAVTAGQSYYFEVDAVNSFGTTTARNTTAKVAT